MLRQQRAHSFPTVIDRFDEAPISKICGRGAAIVGIEDTCAFLIQVSGSWTRTVR